MGSWQAWSRDSDTAREHAVLRQLVDGAHLALPLRHDAPPQYLFPL